MPSKPPPANAAEATRAEPLIDPEVTAAFEQAIELLMLERSRVLEQTASQLGELATIIARRVIAHEISLNPNIVAGLVNEGLAALGAHDRVLVRVGRSFAESCASLTVRLADRGAHAEVRVDEHLPDYGCLVETELGRVDESIESRIATLLQALKPDSDAPQGGQH
jgi:flagellar assembly protein FliH